MIKEILYDSLKITEENSVIENRNFLLLHDDDDTPAIKVINVKDCKFTNVTIYRISHHLKPQELTDENLILLNEFNLTYNPFSGKLEEGWQNDN